MAIYQTRWLAKRLRDIANSIQGKKRDVLSKSSFGDLLHISPLLPPLEGLLDFIVMRIDTKKRLLKINDRKKIHFTKDMVKKIFNVPFGSRPIEFGKRGKENFHDVYLEEYLYTLRDMSVVHKFEWDEHILCDVMREVKKYQDNRNDGKGKFLIGGCLPMLPVIYMDHLDVPRECIVDHTIDYSLPRACFVHEMDFTIVVAVDALDNGFGKRLISFFSNWTHCFSF